MEPTIEEKLNYLKICDVAISYYQSKANSIATNTNQSEEEKEAQMEALHYYQVKEQLVLGLVKDPRFMQYADALVPRQETTRTFL